MERLDKELNRSFYDSEREHDRGRFSTEPSKVHTARLLVPWIVSGLKTHDRLLDIAGGSGSYASQITRAAAVSVVGVDISESMVHQRAEDPLLTENVVGDMEELPFDDETFDAAMVVAALHHVPDPMPALREARRVLRPQGQLFVFEPCSLRNLRGRPRPVTGKPHEFAISSSWLIEQIRAAGLEIEEVRGRNLAIRAIEPFMGAPTLPLYLAADRVDRIIGAIPGAARLGKITMVRARRSS